MVFVFSSLFGAGDLFNVYYKTYAACVCTGCGVTGSRYRYALRFPSTDSLARVRFNDAGAMNTTQVAARWCTVYLRTS